MRSDRQSDDARDARRAAAGDVVAFERLYRRHAARVYGLARRLLRRRDRAEELTQEVFLKAWRECGTYRHEAPFGAWLARLARNLVLNELRRDGRRLPEEQDGGCDDDERGPSAEPAPEASLDLEAAVRALPEGARQVLVLYHFEGLTHEEIARALAVTPRTSKSQLHRARALLREALRPLREP